MAINTRTVNGVHISTLKKIATYVFGKKKFINIVQREHTVKILVDETTGDTEIARFEEFWQVSIVKVKE